MIIICPLCSRINPDKLKETLKEEEVKLGCIDVCKKYDDKCFGYIDGELVYTNSEDEFIKLAKEKTQK